jgi:hypothetical protein
MTRQRSRHPAGRATDREVGVVAAVLAAGSANAGSKVGATTTAQLVWILAARLPQPEARADEHRWTTS